MQTREEFVEMLHSLGITGSVQDGLVRLTASTRHWGRVETATEAASCRYATEAQAVFALWLEGFFPEAWSQRGIPFSGLGKGRRQASDGGAWSAAVRDAARQGIQGFRPSAEGHNAECAEFTPRLEPVSESKLLLVTCECGERTGWELDLALFPPEQVKSAVQWGLMLALANIKVSTAFAWLSQDNKFRKKAGLIPDKDRWGVGTILHFGGSPSEWARVAEVIATEVE